MTNEIQTIYLRGLKDYLVRVKAEIEKDGLVATIDEAIIRVEEALK